MEGSDSARRERERTIVHLLASPSLGGPEHQVIGIAEGLRGSYRTLFVSFAEDGRCRPFLAEVRRRGFEGIELAANFPDLARTTREVGEVLERSRADVLCTSGYKSNLVGWWAARSRKVPCVAIAHGWTGANVRAKLYEALDRFVLHAADRVVCVSRKQASRVRWTRVPERKIAIIPNAIDPGRLRPADAEAFTALRSRLEPGGPVVGAIGRLSPEKGMHILVEAAALIARRRSDVRFLVFGEGPQREKLTRRIADLDLEGRFVLAGHRDDVDRLLGFLDLLVMPSLTEGLPVVLLEACAAALPIVATAVGGIPEVIEHGRHGLLVPRGDPAALAHTILHALAAPRSRITLGRRARARVLDRYGVQAQARAYARLFEALA